MYYERDFLEALPEPKTIPMFEPWQQDLLEAAQYIRNKGWYQGWYEGTDGSVCLLGALHYTGATLKDDMWMDLTMSESVKRFDKFLSHRILGVESDYKVDLRPITVWNDKVCQSKYEAIQALEDCALGGNNVS